jgi:tetratricopeptide (TPR) repeat protein
VSALRTIGRLLTVVVALSMLAAGGLALAMAYLPGEPLVETARSAVVDAALRLTAFEEFGVPIDLHERVEGALANVLLRYGLAPAGLLLLLVALLRGGAKLPPLADEGKPAPPEEEFVAPIEKKAQKKARKQAAALARAKRVLEAAELCFESRLLDEAAKYYIQAGERIRAAEIRHDQNRFIEAAELYFEAGVYDSAGTIFGQQEEYGRAAEAYLKAGNQSVAAEMFEKAGEWRRAAESYEVAEFPRHAAKAYVRCAEWSKAADCLEQVILEGMSGAGHADPARQAETRKLVRMAGDLYVRAGLDDKAETILERGECWSAAGEIALRCGREEKAAELFLKGRDAPRAAKVLKGLGKDTESLRILAEHHRDRGEDEEAAKHFEAAGEHMAAGDLYRMLEQYEKAGACYEQQGEFAQAAEMFRSTEDRERAAQNYERGGFYAEAAECWAVLGDPAREAELLAKAGECLRAGEILHRQGNDDEAIKVLQQVSPEHASFPQASAVLGEIFRNRGMLSLALKKLTHAVGDSDLSRENVQAFYGLATVHEASENFQEALDLYEKILTFDYNYSDVEERLERCKEIVKNQTSQEQAEAASPLTGSQQAGRYRITGKLGRGGMGIVYKAQDTVLDRTVAFKVLPESLKENPQALKNFLREAKSAAQLNHPNIVTVFDAGEQDGVYYIAMEYVDGNTLKEIVKHRGKISAGGITHVLAQMCEALAYAHEKKIVHRDIKTANTMWTRDRKAKIMDFGLAKVIEEVRNHTTVVSGTPYYMSPEQTLGKNVDHRTDIYSLGVTLFELATGTLPFREGNLPYHHVHTPPPDPLDINPELPPAIRNIINRCLEKDPADRYQSTREILSEIKVSQQD